MINHLPVFLSTTLLMLVVPGPDFIVVTRNAMTGGRAQGFRTVVGICGGLAFLALLTASGLAAIVAANDAVLLVLRYLGGGYLVLLGGMLAVSGWRRVRQHPEVEPVGTGYTRSPMTQGFLNNVLNPKALVFYLTFMPRFLASDTPVFGQTLLMGALVVTCAAAWWTLYVTAVGFCGAALARRSVRSAIDVGAGILLGGLGVAALFGVP